MAHSMAVRPSSGPRTWTVIDDGYRTVAPVEAWLEAHPQLWSPNTVRGYTTALAQWWTFLEQRGETDRWREVGVAAVTGFMSWLRNGRTVEHSLIAPTAPSAEPDGEPRRAAQRDSRWPLELAAPPAWWWSGAPQFRRSRCRERIADRPTSAIVRRALSGRGQARVTPRRSKR